MIATATQLPADKHTRHHAQVDPATLATSTALGTGVVRPDPAAEIAREFDPNKKPPVNVLAKAPTEMDGQPEEVVSSIGAINWIRHNTPAFVVNNGARYNFGVRLIADILTVMSGLRKGSESPMRSWAGVVSGTALAMGIYYNEQPPTKEEVEQVKDMSVMEYVPLQIKRAMDPEHHVTATVGVATVINGFLYMAAGRAQHVPGKIQWEMLKGGLTSAAGAALAFIPDQETAWQTSTALFWVRAPSSYINAHQAYFKGIPEKNIAAGDWMQLAKWGFNQSSNVFGMLYGGIKKDEQGRIVKVGHNEYREQTPDVAYPEPEHTSEALDRIRGGDRTEAPLQPVIKDEKLSPKNAVVATGVSTERLQQQAATHTVSNT